MESMLLAEKFTGTGDWHGISSNVDDAEVLPENMAVLREALLDFAQQHREHPKVGAALWALSKFHDKSLLPFFFDELRHHYFARRYHPIWQAYCALGIFLDGWIECQYEDSASDHTALFVAVKCFMQRHGEWTDAPSDLERSNGA